MATSRPQDWMAAFRRSHGLASTAQSTAQAAQTTATSASSDAGTALAAANSAATQAAGAGTLASNAQATANGKNTVFYSATTPSANAANDTWFQTAVQNVPPPSGPATTVVIAQYKATAAGTGSWVSQPLTSATFAYIDAGKISTGTLTGVNVIGTFIETAANVGTGTSPNVVPGVLMNASGQLFCYTNTGPTLSFTGSALTLTNGSINGSTITGALFRTADPATNVPAVVIDGVSGTDHIGFYTGNALQKAIGEIVVGTAPNGANTMGMIEIVPPAMHSSHLTDVRVFIESVDSAGLAGQITLQAPTINLTGSVEAGHVDADSLFVTNATTLGSTLNAANIGTGTGTTVILGSSGFLRALSSSRRYKTKIRAYTADPDVLKIKPKAWVYKTEPDTPQVGPIAEDVEKIAPELVYHNEKGQPESVDKGAIAMVQIQALLDRIDAQDKRIRHLEDQLKKK